ncbi:MAG: sigma-54 dependent transcriptional regulator [Burkholderiales bacterium]|nr:sigma-54 dependent transcriptional regulator [Burkholderiales bacterium]
MPHALIVEDDRDSAEVLAELIKAEGFSAASAGTLAEARQQIVLRAPDVILLDLVLPDGNGMDLFADVEEAADSEIVLITGHASLDTSIQALRLGAADYLTKPVNVRQLKGILARLAPPSELKARVATLEKDVAEHGRFGRLWGRSKPMQEVYRQIARVAGTAVNVLVTGESGTGKEFVASTIHDLSRRRDRPFLAVNCGAISPQLIESEMFGHEKGSFTGAARQHQGYFERANGGTLLLDEITEMPSDLQVKLLRVLETGALLRIGGDEPIHTDVRIIAATNRVPREAVAAGKLREDLFYRLNVFEIHLPPLRERLEDVPLLANHFLAELNAREDASKRFSPEAVETLAGHTWPGNVRQLLNAVQRAFIMAEGNVIDADCLSFEASPASAAPALDGMHVTVKVGTSIAEMERRLIFATLEHCQGRREKAAELLGVSPKTLYNRLREYDRERLRGVDR